MQNQVPDIFAFMVQDPLTPLNGWKWAILLVFWPSYQILGQKCGRIFDNFHYFFHISTVSFAKSGAWYICIYGPRPLAPFIWVKMGVFTRNLRIYPNLALWLKIKLEKWANLFSLSKNFQSKDSFFRKIRCLNFLDF